MNDFWKKIFRQIRPFDHETKWICSQETPQQAWDTCSRGDWLLWMFRVACLKDIGGPKHRQALRAALICLRSGLDYYEAGRERAEGEGLVDALQAWTEESPLVDIEAVDQWALAFDNHKRSTVMAWCLANSTSFAAHAARYGSLLDAVADGVGDAAGCSASLPIEDKSEGVLAYRNAKTDCLARLANLIRAEFPTCPFGDADESAHP